MVISNISSNQRKLLEELESKSENFSFEWDELRGVLSFVRGTILFKAHTAVTREGTHETTLAKFLSQYGTLFGPDQIMRYLRLARNKRDDIGMTHLMYQQFMIDSEHPNRKGPIEVYGSKLAAHFSRDGDLVEIQSSCYPSLLVTNEIKVTTSELQKQLLKDLNGMNAFRLLRNEMKKRNEKLFPLMQQPRIVVYPWKGKQIFAWATYGYGKFSREPDIRESEPKDIIAFGQMFFDASNGELFLFAPTRKGTENPTTGNGLACTPLGGPFTNRSLNIVQIDTTSTYFLKNKTKSRDIVTFDANANTSWVYPNIPARIEDGSIPVSSDTDGDANWNRTASDTTDSQRTASQQPEVDNHFKCSQIYDWYGAVGGRVGWDDNQYSAPLVPNQTINVVSHTYDADWSTSRSVNAYFDKELVSGHWVSHLAFFDGDPTGATVPGWVTDYLSGSDAIVAHEYQHAVTDFSFIDGSGNPGLTYSSWLAAVHEGMSDVFGGLYSGNWWMGDDISPTGQLFRNLAFPRDSSPLDPSKFDHWDDRNNPTPYAPSYHRGDILAHCAYLVAQGGVHQRASRTPTLIPVRGLGREPSGLNIYKASRIFYRAIAHYLSNIGTASGLPTNDETVFRTIRNGCVSAAIDLYGTNSIEHKTTVLGWYAVGLHPAGANYGPDVTFLTWGADWWMSRPYIGISSTDWGARDLFVNNGGTSEWNAKINVMSGGVPTQFENNVYCRVRNIGDQTANNVQIQFEYAKVTTGGATWLPMTDKDGNIQTLSIGNLSAGQSNFPETDQDTPPTTARVKWWIPPLETGETINHFCIRARVSSLNDTNQYNNEVQSNITYTPYVPGSFRAAILVGNDRSETMPLKLNINHTLPSKWKFRFLEQIQGVFLKPGESRRIHVLIDTPDGQSNSIEAPFDGNVVGSISGAYSGSFTGNLFRASFKGHVFTGQMAVNTVTGDHIVGVFSGSLDINTAQLSGSLKAVVQPKSGKVQKELSVHVEGCLRPNRIINIAQLYQGQPIGGVSLQVQVPIPSGSCFHELPPTDTFVKPEKPNNIPVNCIEDAKNLMKCLELNSEVCSVKVRSVNIEVRFKQEESC